MSLSEFHLSNEQVVDIYVEAHQNGTNLSKIADKLGVSRQYLNYRARRLRDAGVRVPLKHDSHKVDVKALNERIRRSDEQEIFNSCSGCAVVVSR